MHGKSQRVHKACDLLLGHHTASSPPTHWVGPIQIFCQVNSIHIYCGLFTPKSALGDSGTEDSQLILACYQPEILK